MENAYGLIKTTGSSCNAESVCSPEYDLVKSGIKNKEAVCVDMVDCTVRDFSQSDFDMSALDIDFENNLRVPNIGCMEIPHGLIPDNVLPSDFKEVCCRGNLKVCVPLQMILAPNFALHPGFSLSFKSTLCRFLPSCFIENDSSPYVLFPIPDFYKKPWESDNDLIDPVDVENSGINKLYALGFGNLGAMPLSKNQGAVYVMKMPKYEELSYFSIMPYLFQTGRMSKTFAQDILFSSLTDSFNITDIKNMADKNPKVRDWLDGIGDLTIIFITSHNKKLAEKIYNNITQPSDMLINLVNTMFPGSDMDIIENVPIVCLPLPAGTTYSYDGKNVTKDPLNRNMFKNKYTTNKNINKDSPIYDWEHDTIGIVARMTPSIDPMKNTDTNDGFTKWDDDQMDQKNVFVLGVEDRNNEYEAFTLSDQNGDWDENGLWKGGFELGKSTNTSSWKQQQDYTFDLDLGLVDKKIEQITENMKNFGYKKHRDININSHPSPFPNYNKYIKSVNADETDMKWSQSGMDIAQYNVNGYGDCRDTVYPTTDTFCLGSYDVAVIVANNFCTNGDIAYNNLNIYDTESQTSLSSFRGDHRDASNDVYSLAISRSDLTCNGNLPVSIDKFGFIPTAAHTMLGASTTTTLFCQSRCYLDMRSGTSPNMSKEQSRYIVRIFSPCEQKYPLYCHDFEKDGDDSISCYYNIQGDGKLKECENDLTVKYDNLSETADQIGSALCAGTPFFRIDKTTDKDTLKSYQVGLICIVVFSIIILTYFFVSRNKTSGKLNWTGLYNDYLPFIPPLILLIIMYVFIQRKWNLFDETTAYTIKQSHFQR